jgi:hypothetical protein
MAKPDDFPKLPPAVRTTPDPEWADLHALIPETQVKCGDCALNTCAKYPNRARYSPNPGTLRNCKEFRRRVLDDRRSA